MMDGKSSKSKVYITNSGRIPVSSYYPQHLQFLSLYRITVTDLSGAHILMRLKFNEVRI